MEDVDTETALLNGLLSQLTEVPWNELQVGNQYLFLNIYHYPRIHRVVSVVMHRHLGGFGFVHTNSPGLSYAIYENEPEFSPNNRFYLVPDVDLLEALQDEMSIIGPVLMTNHITSIIEYVRTIPEMEPYSHLLQPGTQDNQQNQQNQQNQTLNTHNAYHVGRKYMNLQVLYPTGDPILYEPFISEEECVQLCQNRHWIFKQDSLQRHFNTGKQTNPLTNEPLTLQDLEVFTYVERIA